MSKYCPVINDKVLYPVCMECDDKLCQKTPVKSVLSTLKTYKQNLQKIYFHNEILFVGLYGSQNYGLDTPSSDVDCKAIVLPTVWETIIGEDKITSEIDMKTGKIIAKDILFYISLLRKQSIDAIEPLFSKFQVLSDTYREEVEALIGIREEIGRYNPKKVVLCAFGQTMSYLKKYTEKDDMKSAAGILRLNNFVNAYDKDYGFGDCLGSFGVWSRDLLMFAKTGAIRKENIDESVQKAVKNTESFAEKYKNSDFSSNICTQNKMYDFAYNCFEKQHDLCRKQKE